MDGTVAAETAEPKAHRYQGPIFDADTHLYETPDAFTRYMPKEYVEDWGLHYKTGDDGQFALYVGPRKVEISADYMTEDFRIPPPGKLHEWLRAQKEGKSEVDMRVPISSRDDPPGRARGVPRPLGRPLEHPVLRQFRERDQLLRRSGRGPRGLPRL